MGVLIAWSLADTGSVILAALGLGLVIFIHELGHFAVAKWCGVKVERFSIGFGPLLFKFTRGETEYALSLLPLGGYVKMLGQDDADPSQMTSDQIAQNPRSYTAKSVPQRMAIISAGVIMNMISAVLFFILAFGISVQYNPAVIGSVVPGMPAWNAGLQPGDHIVRIGRQAGPKLGFADLRRAVALSDNGEKIDLEVERRGKRIALQVEPARDPNNPDELFPSIHAEVERDLALGERTGGRRPVVPALSAARAEPPFAGGDRLVSIDDRQLKTYSDLSQALSDLRSETVTFGVRRKGEPESAAVTPIRVEPNRFHSLGLRMAIGKIRAIQAGSPADQGEGESRLRVGDTITSIDVGGQVLQVGKDLDVLRLPDFFHQHSGEELKLTCRREVSGGTPVTVTVMVTPQARPEWIDRPDLSVTSCPLAIASLGVALNVLHHVVAVEPGSPAEEAGIREGDTINSLAILPRETEIPGGTPQNLPGQAVVIPLGEERLNWPASFMAMQSFPLNEIQLDVKTPGSKESRNVKLTPVPVEDWFLPLRGIDVVQRTDRKRADNIGEAVSMAIDQTLGAVSEMYLTIKRLFNRRISTKAVGGPLRIAETAFVFAKQGYGDLLLFLAMLSVSLAVMNFLPIPVLDGGHFMFLLWEGITGKPANERIVVTLTWLGLGMILSLMMWVFYMDIRNLGGG